jgi:hypothetical protein
VAFYLRDFGATHRTDGFIAAFAVYSLVVVFAQLLRTTAVPLLSGRSPVLGRVAFAWAIVSAAIVAGGLCEAFASPLAALVAHGSGAAGRHVATVALRVMAGAMGLQIWGAGLAVIGALRNRLIAVGLAYAASAAAGIACFFAFHSVAKEVVLAWSMLAASVVLVAGLVLGVRIHIEHPPSLRRILAAAAALLASTPLPGIFILMYPITLALAHGGRPGQITLFGLAFTACAYLAGFTGQAVSMVEVVTLTRAEGDQVEIRRAAVARAFRYSLLLAAPALGVAAVAGGPIVQALLPQRAGGPHGYFGTAVLLLIPWLVATLAFWAVLPALLVHEGRLRGTRLAVILAALVALHLGATLVLRALAGFDGLILAMAVAPAAFVAAGLRIAVPEAGWTVLRNAAAVLTVGAVSFGVLDLAALALTSSGALTGVVVAVAGACAYGILVWFAYPDSARTMLRLASRR